MASASISPLIIKYEKQLEADPRSRSFAPLAEAYRKIGLLDKAFAVLKKGLRYNPDYVMGYVALSQCYYDRGEYYLAYTTLRPLVSTNRDNLRLQNLFAESSESIGNNEEALDTYKYILFLNPQNKVVAAKVKELEDGLSEAVVYRPSSEVVFEVEDLAVDPENDHSIDEWQQMSLTQKKQDVPDLPKSNNRVEEIENSEDDWLVDAPLEVDFQEDEEEIAEVSEKEVNPVITQTLVNLYLSQGHKEKAIELLKEYKEIQPENEEVKSRLLELLSHSEETIKVEDESEASGRDSLMAQFDKTAQKFADDEAPDLENLKEPLEDFLSALRSKKDQIFHQT